jgi:hypothetical protein
MSEPNLARTLKRLSTVKKLLSNLKIKRHSSTFLKGLLAPSSQFPFFQEIPLNTITSKTLIYSNLLFNIFTSTISSVPSYIIDFKFIKFPPEDITTLITYIKETEDVHTDYTLRKIGYIYDPLKQQLSLVYYQGKCIYLNIEKMFHKANSNNKKLNETLFKLTLIDELLENKSELLTMNNNTLLPQLFFYSEKKGLLYFDTILHHIFTSYKALIPKIYLNYFGVYDEDKQNNKQGNMFICLMVYLFINTFSSFNNNNNVSLRNDNYNVSSNKIITYEEILYKMKMDFINNANKTSSCSYNNIYAMCNDVLQEYFTKSEINKSNSIIDLIKNFHVHFYNKLLHIFNAACDTCNITSQQSPSVKFKIHFPCFTTLCTNCVTNHKCINDYRSILNDKKNEINEEKILFDFLPNYSLKQYVNIFDTKCNVNSNKIISETNDIINNILNIENNVNSYMNVLNNILNDKFISLQNEYQSLIQNESELPSNKQQIETCMAKITEVTNVKSIISDLFYSSNIDDANISKQIHNEYNDIKLLMNNELTRRFKQYETHIIQTSENMFNDSKYNITHLIQETNSSSLNRKYISYIDKRNSVIYVYNTLQKETTSVKTDTLNIKIELTPGTKWLNLCNYLFINGGGLSKKTYLYSYDNNTVTRLNDSLYVHSNHSLLFINKTTVLCIGGVSTTKCEGYNLFNKKWKLELPDLPTLICKASAAVVNDIDVFLFYGVTPSKKQMTQCNDILKCKLGVDNSNNQWECVKIRRDCLYVSPFNMCGVVDLNSKGLMLVGGFRLEKDGSVENIWERYVFDWEGKGMKKIGDRNKGGKTYDEVCFEECRFYEIEKGVLANWGDNLKMIRIKVN